MGVWLCEGPEKRAIKDHVIHSPAIRPLSRLSPTAGSVPNLSIVNEQPFRRVFLLCTFAKAYGLLFCLAILQQHDFRGWPKKEIVKGVGVYQAKDLYKVF